MSDISSSSSSSVPSSSPDSSSDSSNKFVPKNDDDVIDSVEWAVREQSSLRIIGYDTKSSLGHNVSTSRILDMSQLSGIILYEPEELVMSAYSGTPLSLIESTLGEHNQELAFEPVDLSHLLGGESSGSLGGLVSTNICGPRRIRSGSVRDHVLGIHAVSGRAEKFVSGGRVVKNVTGYDLSKGVCGSYGTLAVLTEVTLKVLPRSATESTYVIAGLDDETASLAMSLAMRSSADVSGAAHISALDSAPAASSRTYLRVEGFESSLSGRLDLLGVCLSEFGVADIIPSTESSSTWRDIRDVRIFGDYSSESCVWRISCIPDCGHKIVSKLRGLGAFNVMYDWQGGLVWLEWLDGSARSSEVRSSLSEFGGGHATLIRATESQRLEHPVFEPQPAELSSLSSSYRTYFDPHSVLNPGRMG